jgi:uncharacterized membrane protein YfcA
MRIEATGEAGWSLWDSLIAQFGHHWMLLLASSAAVFLAAMVRGFSGFGFSLLSITAISVFMPVRDIVPSIFLLEVSASINMIPSIWRDVDWRGIGFLLLGYVIALPIGVHALANVAAAPMQLALGVLVFVTGLAMLKGFRLQVTPGPAAMVATGAGSGLLNGAFGAGGPPVVLFYFSTATAAAVGRASVVAFFLMTDTLGLIELGRNGLVTPQSLAQFVAWLPALLLGIAVGARSFKRMDQAEFRRAVLIILVTLALVTLIKAGWELAA